MPYHLQMDLSPGTEDRTNKALIGTKLQLVRIVVRHFPNSPKQPMDGTRSHIPVASLAFASAEPKIRKRVKVKTKVIKIIPLLVQIPQTLGEFSVKCLL